MYKKIHKKLTLLFSCIAGLILIVMTFCCLYMSEKNLYENSMLSFTGDMNTIVANMEQQTVITNDWLAKISASGKHKLILHDNETLLNFSSLNVSEEELKLADSAEEYYNSNLPMNKVTNTDYHSTHTEFQYKDSISKKTYFVCIANVTFKDGRIKAIILYYPKDFYSQIKHQRNLFLFIDISGILLLSVFSWFYTQKLLSPIEEANKKQNTFIASASHELRTPLAVILSSLSVTSNPETDEETRNHFLQLIKSETNRMSLLVDDMLSLARADNNTWSFSMKPTELDTLLLESYEAFLPLAKQQNVSLKIQLPDDTLPTKECDKDRITQVLAILISNAISYQTKKGNSYVLLTLTYHNPDFFISVEDNGIGITKEAKQHIFDRFYRADNSRSTKEHFGLGLCIAKEIVHAHHGDLLVKDTLGGGTTFTIKL